MNSSTAIKPGNAPVQLRNLVLLTDTFFTRHSQLAPAIVTIAVGTLALLVAGPTAALVVTFYTGAGLRVWRKWQQDKAVAALRHETAAEVSFLAADLHAGADPNKALAATLAQWPSGAEMVRKQLWSAWKVSGRLGAPATDICQALGQHLQAQAMLGERLQSQTASIKATAGLLLVLPGFGILLGESMGASPIDFLFHTWAGFGCVALVLALQSLGWLWVRHLLNSVTGQCSSAPTGNGRGPDRFEQRDHVEEEVETSDQSANRTMSQRTPVERSSGETQMFHVEHNETSRAPGKSANSRSWSRRMRDLVVSIVAGLAALTFLSGWFSFVVGVLLAVGSYNFLVRRSNRHSNSMESQVIEQWLWCLDLIAAGLKSGLPFPQVVSAVARAVSAPLSVRVNRVAQQLMMGAPVPDAVAELGSLPGQPRLVSQLERSGWSGAAMASGLQELAASLRRKQVFTSEARAGRASVLLVGPLCLCFLPAFVVAGVVPVIFGLASGIVLPT